MSEQQRENMFNYIFEEDSKDQIPKPTQNSGKKPPKVLREVSGSKNNAAQPFTFHTQSSEFENKSVDMSQDPLKKVTLQDLCPEEKLKVGNLIRRLAEETQEKLNYQKRLEQLQSQYDELKQRFDEVNDKLMQNTHSLREEWQRSMQLLQNSQIKPVTCTESKR